MFFFKCYLYERVFLFTFTLPVLNFQTTMVMAPMDTCAYHFSMMQMTRLILWPCQKIVSRLTDLGIIRGSENSLLNDAHMLERMIFSKMLDVTCYILLLRMSETSHVFLT